MLLTRDINVDWNEVQDVRFQIPAGIVQWRIKEYEEKMSQDKPGETDKQGNPVVAKYMVVMKLEGVAPDEAVGAVKDEYFVLGSNTDPMMTQAQTFYDAIGARQLKQYLGNAQVPWSASLVSTLNSSIGAILLTQVKHKLEKNYRGDIDETTGKVKEYVTANLGRSYKLGEMQPKVIPCGIPECEGCKAYAESHEGGGGVAATAAPRPVTPSAAPTPPMAAAPKPTLVPSPTAPAAPKPPGMPKPPVAPVAPAQAAPAVEVPAGFVQCSICGVLVAEAEYPAHLAVCAAKVAGGVGFKQEA